MSADNSASGLDEQQFDYVIKLKFRKHSIKSDSDAITELLTLLARKGFTYKQYLVDNYILIPVNCSSKRLAKYYWKSRLNDWLNGIGGVDFNPQEELNDPDRVVAELSAAERLRLVHDILMNDGDNGGLDIHGCGKPWEPIFVEVFCLHDQEFNNNWILYWSTKWLLNLQDFTKIRNQFGEQIALYFAFLQYYFMWLAIPAVWSLFVLLQHVEYAKSYSLATSIWSIAFIEFWMREEKNLAMFWNTVNCVRSEKPRPDFRHDRIIKDPVTGENVKYYSPLKRRSKLLITAPIVALMIMVLLAMTFLLFAVRIMLTDYYEGPFKNVVSIVPIVAYSLFIPQLEKLYQSITRRLNKFENYATENEFECQMAQKLFVSSFIINFSSPLLYGLYFVPYGHHLAAYMGQFFRVNQHQMTPDVFKAEISYFVLTGQLVNLISELFIPLIKRFLLDRGKTIIEEVRHAHNRKEIVSVLKKEASSVAQSISSLPDESEKDFLDKIKRESALPAYDVHEDYLEMIIQFGYVLLFASVLPITSLASFINNWIELRCDAVKICINTKRPIPHRVESIGNWIVSLRFFTWLAVITNTIWIFQYSDSSKIHKNLDDNNWNNLLLEVVIWEHAFVFMAYVISKFVQLLPVWAQMETRKNDWNLKMKYLSIIGDDEDMDLVRGTRRVSSAQDLAMDDKLRQTARTHVESLLKQ